jgi:hypothetical protein
MPVLDAGLWILLHRQLQIANCKFEIANLPDRPVIQHPGSSIPYAPGFWQVFGWDSALRVE